MNRVTWIAGGLLVGLAAVFAAGWFGGGSAETTGGAGGAAANVKVDQALADQGESVASAQGCTACHSIDGSTSVGPTWSASYGTEIEIDGGQTVKVDAAYLKESILDPAAQVHAGFAASMSSYEGKVSDQDIAALVEYIKSLSG